LYAVELRVFLARDTDVVDELPNTPPGFNASYTPSRAPRTGFTGGLCVDVVHVQRGDRRIDILDAGSRELGDRA